MASSVSSENTTPKPNVSSGALRSNTTTSCAGSMRLSRIESSSPAGPPPTIAILMHPTSGRGRRCRDHSAWLTVVVRALCSRRAPGRRQRQAPIAADDLLRRVRARPGRVDRGGRPDRADGRRRARRAGGALGGVAAQAPRRRRGRAPRRRGGLPAHAAGARDARGGGRAGLSAPRPPPRPARPGGGGGVLPSPGPPRAARAEWLLVSFSIPEAQRALRHRLRSRLEWLGLGTVAPAVWIGPARIEAEVRSLVAEFGLAGRVELFRAEHAGFTSAPEALARWWDLDAIAAEYRAYLGAWRARLMRIRRRRRPLAPAEAFAAHLRQLDAWRRIPFHDPGLPAAALPADWPGPAAWAVFGELTERLGPVALAHVTGQVAPRARAA